MGTTSEHTRTLILETALRQFRERGYGATTMRGIAAEAGVSTGNAYYYFAGKEALVQELYLRIQDNHHRLAKERLRQGAPLAANLGIAMHAGLEAMTPYHGLGSDLLAPALSAKAPVSPFSADSEVPRNQAVALMALTLDASRGVPGGVLRERLPQMLWLAYLGITLHWALDSSVGQQRSRYLVDGLAPLLARAIALTNLPVGRGMAIDAVALVDRLTAPQSMTTDTWQESPHAG
ncbi:TetR/AcrR family transcriptional regulator [Cellulosimicrobium funkei]|nr:TetR/AcrR family transcriptional regulator [Cellulosimicrobium funkei]